MHKPHETLGHGVGLRAAHYDSWQRAVPGIDWVEVITENVLDVGGRPRRMLERVRSEVPVVLHGVSLSIGSTDPLSLDYLHSVRELAREIDAAWVSDHLCWSSVDDHYLHDLLPMPNTEEALAHVVSRVHRAQDVLGRPLVLENPSTYLGFAESTLTEWDFLAELARQTGCGLLLDVNNVYVSATNHGWSVDAYLAGIPVDAVWQFHLAGHADLGTHLVDTHDAPVCDAVWSLYASAVRRFGATSTLIEWDDRIPPLDAVVAESSRAREVEHRVVEGAVE